MINARTWHRLCLSAYLIFPAVVIAWSLPKDSPFIWPAALVVLWGFVVAGLGAIQGIMLAFGKLHLGCPLCDARSLVSGGGRDGVVLECPHCGALRLRIGRPGALRAIRPGSVDDDLAECPASPGSPLLAPKRHLVPFLIIYIPVVASVVAASVIHRFSAFYLLIPGFWCYGVGGFILDGIFSGRFSDSGGTVGRRRSPIRFWGRIGIWSLFYLFAMAFPIGYAIQERHKAEVPSRQDAGPQRADRAEAK